MKANKKPYTHMFFLPRKFGGGRAGEGKGSTIVINRVSKKQEHLKVFIQSISLQTTPHEASRARRCRVKVQVKTSKTPDGLK